MKNKKVMLGMSGGVDSSVAAYLLLQNGYDVIGVTLKLWEDDNKGNMESSCCSLSSVDDARRVADKLNIPYYVLNFKDIFNEKVINYFKDEYLKGRTPNPCIACNRHVKFDALLNKAISIDIDYIATGHYAKIRYNEAIDRYLLEKSATATKDQTYVLYNMTQYQLSKTLMPIGDYTKDEIRTIAKEIGLGVANKPDSQEICFIPDNNHGKYIEENTNKKILYGNFIDVNGNILGRHKGVIYYTIGQRKGLGIATGKPMYVYDIDTQSNNIILGDEKDIFKDTLVVEDVNFISIDKIEEPLKVTAKIRYSAKESSAMLYPIEDNKIKVVFNEHQRAITKGQSVVFYDGDIVVGGGVITSV